MRPVSDDDPGSSAWAAALIVGRAKPALAPGAELIGEFESSGYRVPPALIRRADGQVIRLHPLLFEVAKQLDGRRALPRVASAIADETGIELSADQVGYLIDDKLAALGVSTYCDGSPPADATTDPFLRLRFRVGVLPERAASFIGGLFAWLHHPVAVFLGVLAAALSEGWLLAYKDVPGAVGQVLTMPAGILLVFAIAAASTAFHEVGHASACRYSGVKPGKMGCGIYVIWPVFYTDITDSYRLSRGGRLRTDLGGVYFNGLFIVALAVGYWRTGFAPLAAAVMAINLEVIQQLLPSVRFDAYYIVSDLIGVPDLFRYIRPMVRRVLLRVPDEQLKALKRWPKAVIAIWVFGVIPVGLAELGMLLWHLPAFVATGEHMAVRLMHAGQAAVSNGDLIGLASVAVQTLPAMLPVAGVALVVSRSLIRAIRLAARRLGGSKLAAADARADASAARASTARGRHRPGGVPSRGMWASTSRGRHAGGRHRPLRRVTGRGRDLAMLR